MLKLCVCRLVFSVFLFIISGKQVNFEIYISFSLYNFVHIWHTEYEIRRMNNKKLLQ